MSDRNLTIRVKSGSKNLLLIAATATAVVAMLTGNLMGTEGDYAAIIAFSTIASVFFLLLWVNSNFESLTFEDDEIRYRYFLFFQRKANRTLLDDVIIGQRSGILKLFVNGKKFAYMNFSVIDITQEEFEAFAARRNFVIEYED